VRPRAAGPGFELLLITDPAARLGLVGSVEAALEGLRPEQAARVAVQLRAKEMSPEALRDAARALRVLTRDVGVKLLINGNLEVARESGADGVHLPERGPGAAEARARLGAAAIIGASCHDPVSLDRAAQGGADYATLSPVFESPGKGTPLGVERFAEWACAARLPVFALGGVTVARAGAVLAAGASGVAVIGAVFRAVDAGAVVREFLATSKGDQPPSRSR
jgi:thiamine-phosphate pyrophosphorylase